MRRLSKVHVDRHRGEAVRWRHSHEDELVWVLEGELTLVTDGGDEVLRAGDCAAFRAGDPDGHHLEQPPFEPDIAA